MGDRKADAASDFKIYSLEDHARLKGMWAGALERTPIPGLVGAYPSADGVVLGKIPRHHTPALLKIVDEGLVNASDQKKSCEGGATPAERVTRIALSFDRESGEVVIENNGPGFPIAVHEGASKSLGREVYVPEVSFAIFLAGSNMEKLPDSVKGGINGIGGKLINVHSEVFAVETVDGDEVYQQTFRDRMRELGEPKIFKARSADALRLPAERRRPHTRLTFRPAYAALGYDPLSAQDAEDLEAWCRWRMCLLAAYVGPKVSTLFNGVRCATTSAKDLAALHVAHDPEAVIMSCTAKAAAEPCSRHPWDIAVAVVPSQKRFAHLSVINGVHTTKGPHVTHVKKILNEAVGARLLRATKATKTANKKTSISDTCRQIFLVVVGPLPGADWGGQRKEELQIAEAKVEPYKIAPGPLGKIAGVVSDSLLQSAEKEVRGRKKRVEAKKYTEARRAGTKDAAACRLLLAEGDSAITLLRAGLTLGAKNPGGPTLEHYGIASLGGVIMNAMKKVTELETGTGDHILVRSEQLRNNNVLKALVEILGLDFTCQYATPAEVQRLRYGGVIVCTDQDLDGTGKILPLVLVWFHLFWPHLIRAGYVKRFMTPVIRAYPRRGADSAQEFYYENEFSRWTEEQGGGAAVSAAFIVKYYKGLAAHDDDEGAAMFRDFEGKVYTFSLDDTAAELFEVYFGSRPALRKVALSTPVAYLSFEEARAIHHARLVPCSVQLRVDAKAYKLDDIQRKIPGVADGIPVARRKVLAGALRRFNANNREVKVFQLGGYIAEHMFYHHGDASLNGTIVGMAQRFPGALQFPYLTGIGQFGSRHFGGSDAGSPRYVSVRLASPFAKAMHPAEDLWILPHVFEDGERAQPRHFVPVLPAALLESFEIPSEGWRHKSFARDVDDVLALTRAYVAGDELVARIAAAAGKAPAGAALEALCLEEGLAAALRERFPLRVSLRGCGEHLTAEEREELVRPYRAYPHSFGFYWPAHGKKETTLHVTELPLRKSTESFLKDLQKPARGRLIAEVDDYSSDAKVDVRIRLVPGGWEEICAANGSAEIDPVEDWLLLRASLKPYLNYYGCDGRVVEFSDDYHAVFFHWAPLRRDLYRLRLEREATLLALKVRLEREIVRYVGMAHELDLAHTADEAAASETLAEQKFPRFDAGLLLAPRYTPTAELEQLVTRGVNVSHDYVLNLRERELVESAKAKREEKICGMERRLAEVEALLAETPFAGASVWAAEVEAVAAAIQRGEKTRWRF